MTVLEFKKPDTIVPHVQGKCRCLDCKHEWEGAKPLESEDLWLECPSCGLMKGRFVAHVGRDEFVWYCNCGNDLFRISEKRIYCPVCGVEPSL